MIWLSPIYKSRTMTTDMISPDYQDIMTIFVAPPPGVGAPGATMGDFDGMIDEMHKRGIKLGTPQGAG